MLKMDEASATVCVAPIMNCMKYKSEDTTLCHECRHGFSGAGSSACVCTAEGKTVQEDENGH